MGVLKTLWRNRRHFKLQIFGVVFFIVVGVFLANLFSMKIVYDNGVQQYMTSTVMFTTNFQMSLSGVKGTVDNIFVDKSKKQCFILATLNEAEMLTMDASQYQMFVTNTTQDGVSIGKPREQLTGEIYMFGTTGRIGLYFTSATPFTNQMKKVTLRSYKKYTANTSPHFVTTQTDAKYDQCHIFFNPGGTAAKSIEFLETHMPGTDFKMSEIYRQISTVSDYQKVCDDLEACQSDMISTINRIAEYKNRLTTNYGLALPEYPEWIKGDKFDPVEVKDEAGNVKSTYYKFVPNFILPGGTDFDWRLGTVNEGYYHLVPDKGAMTMREYLLKLSADKKERKVDSAKFDTWYYSDGTEVEFVESYATKYEQEMKKTTEEYQQLFNDYLSLKTKYQVTLLPTFIEMELESETVGQAYTVRRGNDVVVLY